jgi:hypothetical protein
VRRKSSERRSRCGAGSTGPRPRQAASRVRPLRLRAARMPRPARVRIRSRNPWVLLRRRLLGWNVRLVTETDSQIWVAGDDGRQSTTTEVGSTTPPIHNTTCRQIDRSSRAGLWICGRSRRRSRLTNGTRSPWAGSNWLRAFVLTTEPAMMTKRHRRLPTDTRGKPAVLKKNVSTPVDDGLKYRHSCC